MSGCSGLKSAFADNLVNSQWIGAKEFEYSLLVLAEVRAPDPDPALRRVLPLRVSALILSSWAAGPMTGSVSARMSSAEPANAAPSCRIRRTPIAGLRIHPGQARP